MLKKLLCLSFYIFVSLSSFAYKVVDCDGQKFEFDSPPKVATIVPSVSQMIFAIGAGDMLIANSRYCDYPLESKSKTKIGGFIDPDYEKIATLKPDLFIMPYTADSRIKDRLSKLGIKCFILNKEGLENISKDVILLGQLFDKELLAKSIADNFNKAMSPTIVEDNKKTRSLFLFGQMLAGKNSYVGDLLNVCGLYNCADTLGRPWVTPSKEFILMSNVDVIFAEFETEESKKDVENMLKSDSIWRLTPAVKNNKIFFIPRNLIIIPSLRVAEALILMKSYLEHSSDSKKAK